MQTYKLRWAGYLVRMPDNVTTKKYCCASQVVTQLSGRLRWLDCLKKCLLILKISLWKTKAKSMTT